MNLSKRETRTLELIVEGKKPGEIAFAFGTQRESVTRLLARIRLKLGATTNEQAVAIWLKSGATGG